MTSRVMEVDDDGRRVAGWTKRVSFAVLLVAVGLVGGACSGQKSVDKPDSPEGGGKKAENSGGELPGEGGDDEETGLEFRLSEASGDGTERARAKTVEGTELSAEETDTLLARLPAMQKGPDETEFAFRDRSEPAPEAGQVVETSFPPDVQRAAPEADGDGDTAGEGLEVVRRAPEGDVDLAPRLSVTFSEPMVSVGSHEAAEEFTPVRLEPDVEGSWRWIGTKTVVFEPDAERLPMATEYKVTVRGGAESKAGGQLDDAEVWTFRTPPLEVERWHPTGGPHELRPTGFVEFNQRVEPREIVEHLKVWGGGRMFHVNRVSEATAREDEDVEPLIEQARDGHWVAFRTSEALPARTSFQMALEKGAPSAEGPRVTKKAQHTQFRTYDGLAFKDDECGWETCRPLSEWRLQFNNTIDKESFEPSMIDVEPDLKGKEVEVEGSTVTIQGQSRGRTSYRVHLKAELPDIYGQTLGASETVTVDVKSARPDLQGPGQMVVLDPAGPPSLQVWSVNWASLDVKIWRVDPSDWGAYRGSRRREPKSRRVPGKKVVDRTVSVDGKRDEYTKTSLDLGKALDGEHGHLIVEVRPKALMEGATRDEADENASPEEVYTWVQRTDIGLDAYRDFSKVVGWATSLKSGEPIEDVELSVMGAGESEKTNEDGVATLELPELQDDQGESDESEGGGGLGGLSGQGDDLDLPKGLVAKTEEDSALLPESDMLRGGMKGWQTRDKKLIRFYTLNSREMYRPGETVRIKGWVRKANLGQKGALEFLPDDATVTWRAIGPRSNDLGDGEVELTDTGGFEIELELGEDVNLGDAQIQTKVTGTEWHETVQYDYFQIQEFRTPKFEVDASAPAGPHVVGDSVEVTAEATYYAGGALGGAEARWRVASRSTDYRPPGWDEFAFGQWSPRWWGQSSSRHTTDEIVGTTDAQGRFAAEMELESVAPPEATRVTAEAAVQDVTRQVISSETRFLVHPARTYVGMRTGRNFVEKGEPIEVDLVAVDLEGNVEEGRKIRVVAERMDWTREDGDIKEVVEDRDVCTVASGKDSVECSFETPVGGSYRLSAFVDDESGRTNRSRMRVWVGGTDRPSARTVEMEEIRLVPDKEEYEPGDTAEILVQTPFEPAEGLLTLRYHEIVETRRFSMDGRSTTLEIDIDEADIPELKAHVQLVGSASRQTDEGDPLSDVPDRPAQAAGTLELPVSRESRELDVDVAAESSSARPGEQVDVTVDVRGPDGEPVAGSEVAVVVVDEAVLALTGYELFDPLTSFYPTPSTWVWDYHLRDHVVLASLDELRDGSGDVQPEVVASEPEVMGKKKYRSASTLAGDQTVAVRKDFRALAHWAPRLTTGEDGTAETTVELPDNLTRWRVMAVAVDGEHNAGKAESSVTTRLPLSVEPSMPRFLNWGDEVELPVLVRNQSDESRTVQLAARARNLELTGPAGVEFEVPAEGRVEVPMSATTKDAGEARLQFVAGFAGDGSADAAEVEFPVWTPATTEDFATYGTLGPKEDGDDANNDGQKTASVVRQSVSVPDDVLEQFGGLEVSTSSTALQQLTDAFLYLVEYPYECSEQVASRMLGVAALSDVLRKFDVEGMPDDGDIEEAMTRDIETLVRLQRGDGGFAMWRSGGALSPWASVHAAHALWKADQAGWEVPSEALERAGGFLEDIEGHLPEEWSGKVRNTVHAYALHVLEKMGRPQVDEAVELAGQKLGDELSLEAAGWLTPTLDGTSAGDRALTELWRQLGNRARESASSIHYATSYREDEGHLVMASNRRADAVLLEAMVEAELNTANASKVVRGLLARRTKGRWANTQENVFALLALETYFEQYEATSPDFVARMWLGDGYLGEHAYEGRTAKRQYVEVPMKAVAEQTGGEEADLVLQKDGVGRMYYRIGMKYAPESLELAAADRGFAVDRRYEAVDDPGDVRRRDDGTWVVRAGARVRVELTMVAPTRRYHVALVDPLAAGFEPLNPALETTGTIPNDPDAGDGDVGPYWWWHRPWYEHQNLRDERVEAFASTVWEGVHTYSYVVRATTPGEFVVPPARAEEMYHPETFGRTATERVVVER